MLCVSHRLPMITNPVWWVNNSVVDDPTQVVFIDGSRQFVVALDNSFSSVAASPLMFNRSKKSNAITHLSATSGLLDFLPVSFLTIPKRWQIRAHWCRWSILPTKIDSTALGASIPKSMVWYTKQSLSYLLVWRSSGLIRALL